MAGIHHWRLALQIYAYIIFIGHAEIPWRVYYLVILNISKNAPFQDCAVDGSIARGIICPKT